MVIPWSIKLGHVFCRVAHSAPTQTPVMALVWLTGAWRAGARERTAAMSSRAAERAVVGDARPPRRHSPAHGHVHPRPDGHTAHAARHRGLTHAADWHSDLIITTAPRLALWRRLFSAIDTSVSWPGLNGCQIAQSRRPDRKVLISRGRDSRN